jgi:tellurite resistance protein TerC
LSGFLSLLSFLILALDLGVLIKHPHYKHKEATKWTVIWVTISFSFLVLSIGYMLTTIFRILTILKPIGAAIKFITGYLIELSLSVDNIFVIAIIFSAFKIPQKYQHRVLFWGILGAIFWG